MANCRWEEIPAFIRKRTPFEHSSIRGNFFYNVYTVKCKGTLVAKINTQGELIEFNKLSTGIAENKITDIISQIYSLNPEPNNEGN